MRIEATDLRPGFTLEEVKKLFFLRKDLDDLSGAEKMQLLAKLNVVGLRDIRLDTVHLLLCIMHEAREVDQPGFLRRVFLPWQRLKRATRPHYERITAEMARISDFEAGSVQEAAHVGNIYRSLVSDLFDPYLSLVVAATQFREGSFSTLENADVGQGERNKYEYLSARVRQIYGDRPNFLSGYDPRVRNALSHTGANGVAYENGRAIFKNVKRGSPPSAETVIWSFDELQYRALQLMECVTSIDVAVEIFGLDCGEVITGDFETYSQFAWHAVDPADCVRLRQRHEALVDRVRSDVTQSPEDRVRLLAPVLFYNCGLRNMPCSGVRVNDGWSKVVVTVPPDVTDLTNDAELTTRLVELVRYAILARTVFGPMFSAVAVAEGHANDVPRLEGAWKGEELDQYIEERAGLLDLMHDARWTLEGRPLSLQVDFKNVETLEMASPSAPFPRKTRE